MIEAVQELYKDVDCMNWSMKKWAILVGAKCGFNYEDRPDLKISLKMVMNEH